LSVATRSASGRIPDFLILGAMKAGTTTLYGYLARHPDIFLSTPKEPQFFSREPIFARGLDWYRGLFAGAGPEQVCGEASTCYSRWPHFGDVATRIAKHLPDAKLIYQMRHPVDRAYSHYAHLMQERLVRGSGPWIVFEEALETIPEILDASLYAVQIRQYLEHFDRSRMLLTTLDDLRARPAETLVEAQRFLGLPPRDLTAEGPLTENQWGDRMARVRVREGLAQLRRAPGVAAVAGLLPRELQRRARAWVARPRVRRLLFARQIHQHRQALPPMRPETRARLATRLAEPTRDLEALTGRSFSAWLGQGAAP
jgi:hypothetical protein